MTIVRVYIPPSENDSATLQKLEEALRNKSHQHKTIILGDLNVDLDNPKDLRGMEIVETIKSYQ